MNRLLLEYLNKILHEYTDDEKMQIGIPLDAKASGGRWFRGDVYIGRVVDGRFVGPEFDADSDNTEPVDASRDTAQPDTDSGKKEKKGRGGKKSPSWTGPTVHREALSPSKVFTDEDEPILIDDERGKGIILRQGGSRDNDVEIREVDVSDEAINTRVDEIVEENPRFKSALTPECDSGDAECMERHRTIRKTIADAVRRKRTAHNRNVQTLIKCEQARLAAKKPSRAPRNSCVRVLKSGQGGIQEIVTALETKLKELGLEGNKEAVAAMEEFLKLGQIEPPITKQKIEAVLAEIMQKLENSPLSSTIPYMGELITAAILSTMGQTVMIPTSGQFPIADVFSLVDSPVLGGQELRAIMTSIGIEPEDGDSDDLVFRFGKWSVKLDGGGASGNSGKIEYTEFDLPDVVDDLTTLTKLHGTSAGGIFDNGYRGPRKPSEPRSGASKEKQDKYERSMEIWREEDRKAREAALPIVQKNLDNAEAKIMDTMKKYEADIRAYFGFSEEAPPTLEEIAAMLSTGSKLCIGRESGIPQAGPESSINAVAAKNNPLNGRMWQLASLNGFITEAIHNRQATRQQYFGFMARRNRGDFAMTDGKHTMLAMGYQHYKQKRESQGYILPDAGQSGFTVPVNVEEMRTMGTPSTKCKAEKINEGVCQDDVYRDVLEVVLRILK
jgi:hypothetical protein